MFRFFSGQQESKPTFPTLQDEVDALASAMSSGTHLLADEYELGESQLAEQSSPYHKLGLCVFVMLRALLGHEPEAIKRATEYIADSEETSADFKARAQTSEPFESKIYPLGAQYSLCEAHVQVMSAVTGFLLRGGVTESLKGFYKVRKAYMTLQDIAAAEQRYLDANEFSDKLDQISSPKSPISPIQSPLEDNDTHHLFVHPIDIFIHSGSNLCLGMMEVLLSMVPPSLTTIIHAIGFKADTQAGLKMLWRAQMAEDVHSALASMTLLDFYNQIASFSDMLEPDAIPYDRLEAVLVRMKTLYPRSRMWSMMECRYLMLARKSETAVEKCHTDKPSPIKQLEGQIMFNRSMALLHLHKYGDAAKSWLECATLNDWSHAMYFYVAGCCYAELYRLQVKSSTPDPSLVDQYSKRATELLLQVPTKSSKKGAFGRKEPMDAFVSRKISKWQARAAAKKITLIDAIGVAPIEEIIYMWRSHKMMDDEQLSFSLERITQHSDDDNLPIDEQCMLYTLQAALLTQLHKYADAREVLTTKVLTKSRNDMAGQYKDNWPLPMAVYEVGLADWKEAMDTKDTVARRKLFESCSGWVNKASKSEAHDFSAKTEMSLRTANKALEKLLA